MAADLPAQLTGFPRLVEASAAVAAPLAVASALVANPARHADWLSMHAAFREAPPEVASAGDAFEEQVTLMGIPADISWVVREAEAGLTALDGTGPMNLTLALRMEVAQDEADTVTFTIRAGIGGDPVEGPLGATVATSVEEALVESAERFAALAAQLAADPAESTGSRFPQRSVVHERTGVAWTPAPRSLVGVGQVVAARAGPRGRRRGPGDARRPGAAARGRRQRCGRGAAARRRRGLHVRQRLVDLPRRRTR